MFPARYFPASYFAPRYFPEAGADIDGGYYPRGYFAGGYFAPTYFPKAPAAISALLGGRADVTLVAAGTLIRLPNTLCAKVKSTPGLIGKTLSTPQLLGTLRGRYDR
jgi:hypothetical protein